MSTKMAEENNITNLERQRLQLEQQLTDLQHSIYQWRIWNAEYDGLKEEISLLDETGTSDDIVRIGKEFNGTVVTEDEVRLLLGEEKSSSKSTPRLRSRKQVVDAINRRIDYVLDNIKVLEKRATNAENKLNAVLVVLNPDSGVDEEGLPMMDIVEELDEDGAVISGSTTVPGKSAEELMDILKKAGVDDMVEASEASKKGSAQKTMTESTSEISSNSVQEEPEEDKRAATQPSTTDDAIASASNVPNVDSTSDAGKQAVVRVDHNTEDPATMEIDESPEDAALRMDMLRYGLEEVGAVVAELELDESGSEFSIDDDDYFMSGDDDYEEDEYGRATGRVLGDDYVRQMQELEAKLNARGLQNVGSDTSALPSEVRADLEQARPALKPATAKEKPAKKKKVAFAEQLDIAPEPPTQPAASKLKDQQPTGKNKKPEIPTMQDTIVERTGSDEKGSREESKSKKKTSRFKSIRNTPAPSSSFLAESASSGSGSGVKAPLYPPPLYPARPSAPKPFSQPIIDPGEKNPSPFTSSKTNKPLLAETLVEREGGDTPSNPPDFDDIDETLHKREVAAEFYKMRNRKIQESGGFLQDPEVESIAFEGDGDNDDGEQELKPKKVSRFKAARAK